MSDLRGKRQRLLKRELSLGTSWASSHELLDLWLLATMISLRFTTWRTKPLGAKTEDSYVPNISPHLIAGMGQVDVWESNQM